MPYVHVTRTPRLGLTDHKSVHPAIDTDPPPGQRSHYAGESDGALHTVDVWDSRADADRFAAERLFPAFEASGVRPSADMTILAFDAEDDDV
jgi:hypothetical protein